MPKVKDEIVSSLIQSLTKVRFAAANYQTDPNDAEMLAIIERESKTAVTLAIALRDLP